MEREDKTIFFVYQEKSIVKWFIDVKEAIEFAMKNRLMLERVHLKPNGSVHQMILYDGKK